MEELTSLLIVFFVMSIYCCLFAIKPELYFKIPFQKWYFKVLIKQYGMEKTIKLAKYVHTGMLIVLLILFFGGLFYLFY